MHTINRCNYHFLLLLFLNKLFINILFSIITLTQEKFWYYKFGEHVEMPLLLATTAMATYLLSNWYTNDNVVMYVKISIYANTNNTIKKKETKLKYTDMMEGKRRAQKFLPLFHSSLSLFHSKIEKKFKSFFFSLNNGTVFDIYFFFFELFSLIKQNRRNQRVWLAFYINQKFTTDFFSFPKFYWKTGSPCVCVCYWKNLSFFSFCDVLAFPTKKKTTMKAFA